MTEPSTPLTQPAVDPALIARVKGIILQPKTEWARIDDEFATTRSLFTRYAMILAAIGPICSLIGGQLLPLFGTPMSILGALLVAVVSYVMWLVGVFGLIPMLGVLAILGLYSFYLLYLGLPMLMKVPADKAVGYFIVTVILGLVMTFIINAIVGMIGASFLVAGAGMAAITGGY